MTRTRGDTGSAEDPRASLAAVAALRRMADRMERDAVDSALLQGWTWQQIAGELGVSRQAAHKRHASRPRTGTPDTEDHR